MHIYRVDTQVDEYGDVIRSDIIPVDFINDACPAYVEQDEGETDDAFVEAFAAALARCGISASSIAATREYQCFGIRAPGQVFVKMERRMAIDRLCIPMSDV